MQWEGYEKRKKRTRVWYVNTDILTSILKGFWYFWYRLPIILRDYENKKNTSVNCSSSRFLSCAVSFLKFLLFLLLKWKYFWTVVAIALTVKVRNMKTIENSFAILCPFISSWFLNQVKRNCYDRRLRAYYQWQNQGVDLVFMFSPRPHSSQTLIKWWNYSVCEVHIGKNIDSFFFLIFGFCFVLHLLN